MTSPETLKPDELVERLRTHACYWTVGDPRSEDCAEACDFAADRILALQSDLERVTAEREALTKERSNLIATKRDQLAALSNTIVEVTDKWRDADYRATTAEAALVKARTALEPFARIAGDYSDSEDSDFQVWKDFDVLGASLPLKHFRAARLALSGEEENGR